MPDATWYEVSWYRLVIVPRLVSSDTACYVFHPNGRKSRKADDRGNVDWHKTFIGAKGRTRTPLLCQDSIAAK